jgi:hypothetical protein
MPQLALVAANIRNEPQNRHESSVRNQFYMRSFKAEPQNYPKSCAVNIHKIGE